MPGAGTTSHEIPPSPSFGVWRVRTTVVEKDSKREVSAKEYPIAFTDGKKQPPVVGPTAKGGRPFPVPPFQYKQWSLKDWGIGIYDEVPTGPNSYDKEIRVMESRDTFSVKEAMG